MKYFTILRHRLWKSALRNYPEGSLLPKWGILLRGILFPLKSLCTTVSSDYGYQAKTDTWNFYGVTYSTEALMALAQSDGEIYRIRNNNGVIVLEKYYCEQ